MAQGVWLSHDNFLIITTENRNGLNMKRKEGHLKIKAKKALRTVIHKQEHRSAVFKPK